MKISQFAGGNLQTLLSKVGPLLVGIAALSSIASAATAEQLATQHVILVTIDGLRVEELFGGADDRLLNDTDGGVRDVAKTREQFWAESVEERRRRLMPFVWETIASRGQLLGSQSHNCFVRVNNGLYFSYPGYSELLCGFADPGIDSNDKRYNPNVTVLEWLEAHEEFRQRIAAFCSWDVFPFILNSPRSRISVNAGWTDLETFADETSRREWNAVASQLPRYWDNVRYDAFTVRGAIEYLRARQPRVLYVALGETDDWAHDGRYDLYLDAARRSDEAIKLLWGTCQSMPGYRNRTSLVITTDHGRGVDRTGWKSHGVSQPGSEYIWLAVLGPDTPPLGVVHDLNASQAQVAATIAALLGENFATHDPRIQPPIAGVIDQQ